MVGIVRIVRAVQRTTRTAVFIRSVLVGLLALAATYSYAQYDGGFFRAFGGLRGEQGDPAELPPAQWPDRNFTACHILYSSVRREPSGAGWRTDYPWGERHLLMRLSELTKTRVSRSAPTIPHSWLVRLTDDALFGCPYLMASDVGTIGLTDIEAARLRLYLEKGGFMWVDDFWGSYAWEQWVSEISRVLPPSEYPIRDIGPDHPLMKMQYEIKELPQIPSIQAWRGAPEETSERGYDSAEPHVRAISDRHGNVMVLMTHNTDISDAWEREGEDPRYFYLFSPKGYAVGINAILYAMTH
jgi:hypothetical protein